MARLVRAVRVAAVGLILLLWSLIAADLAHEHQLHQSQAARDAQNFGIAIEKHVDSTLLAVDALLLALRHEIMERQRLDAHIDLIEWIRRGPLKDSVLQVGVVDADGLLIYTSNAPGQRPTFVGDREHFRAHVDDRRDRLFIGAPIELRTLAARAIPLSRAIAGANGEFRGIVTVLLRPEHFSSFFTAIDLGNRGAVTLVRDGIVIARGSRTAEATDPLGLDLRDALPPPTLLTENRKLSGPGDGLPRLTHFRRLSTQPLAIVVSLAEEDYLAEFRESLNHQLLVGTVMTLAMIALASLLIRLARHLDGARQAAAAEEARYRELFADAPLAYHSLDAGGHILEVNAAWEELFGYRLDEVRGQPLASYVAEASLDGMATRFRNFLRDGRIDGAEFAIVRRDGSTRVVAISGRTAHHGDGSVRQTHCLLADVTTARQQEIALKTSEARLRGIVENINVAAWELDPATWQFTYVSPQVEAMFGYPAADWLQPQFWAEHLYPDDRLEAVQHCFRNAHELRDHDFEYRFLRHDGSIAWVRDIVKVIAGDDGKAARLTGVMLDITVEKATSDALARQHALLRSLIDSVPDLIFFKDRDSVYLGCNKAFAEFAGRPEAEQVGRTDFDFFDHDTAEFFRRQDQAMLAGGKPRRNEEWVVYPDGHRVLLDTLKAPFLGPQGEALGLIGISRDITAQKRAEEAALLAHAVFESTTEGIMITDPDATILSVNPAFCRITGWNAEEAIGRRASLLASGRHPPEFYAVMWATLRNEGHWQGEIWNRRRDGEIYVESLTVNALRDAAGATVRYVGQFSDITRRKEQEEQIWRQANFDALTGMPNRILFRDRLDRALARARRNGGQVGLMFIDLDRFKWINDSLGHAAGDRLLVEAAERLRACVRDEDTVARLGGDEFTVIIQGLADLEPLRAIADKILAALAAAFELEGSLQHISGSIGITTFPADGGDAAALLRNADIAMYRAKDAGRNRYQFYSAEMQTDALARVQIENELRDALERGEFALHYQPIVDADSGELIAAEALLRWQHPQRGRLAPGDFIAVAEETGLILPIGEWVIDNACRQWREWNDAGAPRLELAINVSTLHFRDPRLRGCLAEALARHRMPPALLTLEVTEGLLLGHAPATTERLRELQDLGVRYALDDFGTGYSSLSTLKAFPFDAIKVDRSFVADCVDHPDDAHLIEAIVFMAHSLGLQVVAEGVETTAQLDFLREIGCDHAQGYLISRPVEAAALPALLGRRILLPDPLQTAEESRFLAALRQPEVDAEVWVRRLLAERDPALAEAFDRHGCRIGDLDLCDTIVAHLQWRNRIEAIVIDAGDAMSVGEAGDGRRCPLGGWMLAQAATPLAGDPAFATLTAAHDEFHRLAGSIVDDAHLGRRSEARRRVRGMLFRRRSHLVVTALIELFAAARSDDTGAAAPPTDRRSA